MPLYVFAVIVGAALLVFEFRREIFGGRRDRPDERFPPPPPPRPARPEGPRMPLEDQIAALAAAGLPLNPGVSIDDLLHSFPREEFESDAFILLLIMYGMEIENPPYGRRFCDGAWDFDTECIVSDGSYVAIVRDLAAITGAPEIVSAVSDSVDLIKGAARLTYTIGTRTRVIAPVVQDDWADPATVETIMDDIAAAIGDGRWFWAVENGQASTVFFLPAAIAERVNALRPDILAECC